MNKMDGEMKVIMWISTLVAAVVITVSCLFAQGVQHDRQNRQEIRKICVAKGSVDKNNCTLILTQQGGRR